MFIATRDARSAKLRRSGMFIGTGTNNGLRQAPSGAAWTHSSAPQSDMPLLTELGSRGVRLSYKHAAPMELWATGRPRQLRQERHVYSHTCRTVRQAP